MIQTANLIGSISRNAGGLHESVRRLVQCAAEQGVGVRILTVEDEFTQKDLDVWKPIEIDVFPPTWPRFFGYSPGFLKVLEEHRPDLTHTHGIWMYPSIATAAYCSRRRVPYMISPHGMLDPWAVSHRRWKKVFAYSIYEGSHVHGASCIRALCESEARAIRRMNLKNAIAIIPNGIDLPADPTDAEGSQKQQAPWNAMVEPGNKILLFLSRIHPKKGLVNLLKAWAIYLKSGRESQSAEWVLVIAGWDQGGHENELKRLCDELGINWSATQDGSSELPSEKLSRRTQNPSVVFVGPQFAENKAACYANCDAFVLPSFSEGLPMVVLEAWAYGRPVLMTDACNLPEGFAAGSAFRITTSVEGILKGLQALAGLGDVERVEMGQRGKKLVKSQFTWDAIANQLKVTYEWMMGGGARPGWMHP